MQISDLAGWVRDLDEPSVAPLLAKLLDTLDSFVEIGLGYLSLDRPSGTLSGGESQRTKMIRHLGSSLTDVTYVFDEPTAGLHPHDVQRMNDLLLRLRDKGNTVLVVEHEPETMAIADHVVDLGPGAGTAGGTICFEGTVEGLRASGTLTGRHLDDRAALKETVRTPSGVLPVRGASTHNLRDVDVDIPLGVLVVLTGVAGSGKSSLVHGSVSGRDGVVAVDQSPIRGSRRSNPATYTGLLDPIRSAFAKANGVKPALFSPNSAGACPACNGAGVVYTDLAMMASVATVCEECEGKRFQAAGARAPPRRSRHQRGARHAGDAGRRSSSARARRAHRPRTPSSSRLADVGLGYLSLGQPLTTLSGGERQRLKLATRMAEKGDVYVLDEPTTGLHLADVEQLLGAARPAGRLRHVRGRHRAPPGGDGARRLDHRSGTGRRPRRRPHRLRGHPGRTRRGRARPSPGSTSRRTRAADPGGERSRVRPSATRCGRQSPGQRRRWPGWAGARGRRAASGWTAGPAPRPRSPALDAPAKWRRVGAAEEPVHARGAGRDREQADVLAAGDRPGIEHPVSPDTAGRTPRRCGRPPPRR